VAAAAAAAAVDDGSDAHPVIRVTFLGTSASRPTVSRNVSAIAINRAGELLLFDCGEGTQRQMMRFGTGFTVSDIFFTHMHADHLLGLTGLLRTFGLQGREEPIRLHGPLGSSLVLEQAVNLGVERVGFPVEIHEVAPGVALARPEYDVLAFRTRHGRHSLGYALVEHERLGRFDPARARELGVPEGPLFGQLHKGETIEIDGRVIAPELVVGPPRPGRRVVYTGDTRPAREIVRIAQDADLLIHDATFGHDEAERARATGHATAREAAQTALRAAVAKLVLTHISSRYTEDVRPLEREARQVFRNSIVAYDGLEIEVGYRDSEP
jgi:ribonuclease Z